MGKEKPPRRANASSKPLHSRISYLYQAATYLSNVQAASSALTLAPGDPSEPRTNSNRQTTESPHTLEQCPKGNGASKRTKLNHLPLSRLLLSQLRDVSLKGQVRLSPDVKQSICRRCYTLLIPGQSSTVTIENLSRNGRKPWADMLLITCNGCRAEKRFPVGLNRQPSRANRKSRRFSNDQGYIKMVSTSIWEPVIASQ